MTTFRGWLVEKTDAGGEQRQTATLRELDSARLTEGDTWIDVAASSINYKDAMALTGRPGIVRTWPLIAGIDVVGTVRSSESGRWSAGDRVLLNGAGLGESRDGGLAELARVDGASLVRVPGRFSPSQAAALGTAGFTAMLAVLAIERHGVRPGDGPVLVTGAAGGVGSITIALLAHLGFEVVASTGRVDTEGAYLRRLGASELLDRAELSEPGKPLQSQRWAAVADAVGSATLVNALAQTRYGGVVTACGLAQGADLPATVLPFILRGVTLAGVNSVDAPLTLREEAWSRLARDLDLALLDEMTEVFALTEASSIAENVLAGKVRGRSVIDVTA
ncbi:putative quinone oxidoreductase, YhdH/YhfP family [Paramicrobacterium humi]|uniref:Putative quinone oxidoreductase, YhdH/YhfP family n=1 Tax=Paramicrobacterium humi TaxID=640635 RepID=A0A1H4JVC8_9MICO|nr:MDR family oxidoreductase [Microbacterium humi]SEB49956.1 putative quinone oxidoreductase, YhdH/YhfP family [Microbacterium humi]